MKINLQRKIRIAKRARLGRMFCRLAGDQTGAVMMEYVILCVLVAAAAVIAATGFGTQIVGGFKTMIYGVSGNPNGQAEAQAQQNQNNAPKQAGAADTSRGKIAPGNTGSQ